MATKLTRNELPEGKDITDFSYQGRLATDQGDFGVDVGRADLEALDQSGEPLPKYYHGGVVQSGDGAWWVYLEWGKPNGAPSWDGTTAQQDFQFVSGKDEKDARAFFAKQMASKNSKRLVEKDIDGTSRWVSKGTSSGYAVTNNSLYGIPTGAPPPAAAAPEPAPQAPAAPKPEVVPFSAALAPLVDAATQGKALSEQNHHDLTVTAYPLALHISLPPVGGSDSAPGRQSNVLLRGADLLLPNAQIPLEQIEGVNTDGNLTIQYGGNTATCEASLSAPGGEWLQRRVNLYIARRKAGLSMKAALFPDAA